VRLAVRSTTRLLLSLLIYVWLSSSDSEGEVGRLDRRIELTTRIVRKEAYVRERIVRDRSRGISRACPASGPDSRMVSSRYRSIPSRMRMMGSSNDGLPRAGSSLPSPGSALVGTRAFSS
jgi:hypothetical protein